MRWGPLSLVAPVANGTLAAGGLLSNYAPVTGSDNIPASTINPYPTAQADFYGNPRPETGDTNGRIDAGAIEVTSGAGAPTPFAILGPAIRLPVQSPAQGGAP